MISHGLDPRHDDGVGGEEDALPLVSCDTFVAMGDVTQTGEVRVGGSTRFLNSEYTFQHFRLFLARTPTDPKERFKK